MTSALRSMALGVDSLDRAEELFVGLLGGRPTADGDGRLAIRFPPGIDVELWDGSHGLRLLTFSVDDPDRTRHELVALGYRDAGEALDAPPGYGGAVALTHDDGKPSVVAGPTGPCVRSLDHVCAPSGDLERSIAVFAGVLGGDVVFGGDNDTMGTRSAQVRFRPGTKVELLHARRANVPVGRFAERFPGRYHHLTMLTADLPRLVARLEAAGYPLIDTDLDSRPTWRETFIRPSASFGSLLQLVDTPLEYKEPLADHVIDDILAGRLTSDSYQMQLRDDSTGRLVV